MSWEKKCLVCGIDMENKFSPYETCDKCSGVRSREELSKLSVDEQIKLRQELEVIERKAHREGYNLRSQCKHVRLTNKHWCYDQWVDEWIDNNLAHKASEDEDTHVWCALCGKDLGWECPKNPNGYCEYPENFKEEEEYGVTILYCAYCHRPKDRMGYYSNAMLGGRYDPSYEPTKEELEEYYQKMKGRCKIFPFIDPENCEGYNIRYSKTE